MSNEQHPTEVKRLLDHNGNPIEIADKVDEPHRFGFFRIPPDCHVKGLDGISGDKPYPWHGYNGLGHKEHAERRSEKPT